MKRTGQIRRGGHELPDRAGQRLMKIAINKAHFPVTVLGPGRRIGIWTQGCRIHCKGCVSQDTWAADPGRETTVARLITWCRKTTGGAHSTA
jgi:anaerobic ribonucleoside-triphosphate reductase activating protein